MWGETMDLVIGGAFQGKLSWAAREYDLKPEELCDLAAEEPRAGARCCFHLEERAGINVSEGTWGGHRIVYNDVFNTVLETGDHGAFNS